MSLFIVLLTAIGGALIDAINPSDHALLITGTGIVLAVPLAVRIIKRQFDPFEPLVVVTLAYAAMFVVRPLAMIARNDFAYSTGGAGSNVGAVVDASRGFTQMLELGFVGALALMIGYWARTGHLIARSLPEPRRETTVASSATVAVAFALLGTALFAALIVFGGGDSALVLLLQGRSAALSQLLIRSNKYFLYGPLLLLPASLTLLALGRLAQTRVLTALGAIAGTVLVLTAAPAGSRSELFAFAAGLAILYYVSRSRRPSVLALVSAVVVALFVSSLILQLRTAGPGRAAGIGNAVQHLVRQPLSVFDPITSQNDAAEAPGLAAALSLPRGTLPETYGGSIVGDLATRAVPRALWPGKPVPPRQRITALLLGNQNAYVNGVSPEFSVLLYPYLDFRLPGLIVFMLLYGIAIRTMWEYFLKHGESLFAQLLLALVVPALAAGVRDGPVDTAVRLLFTLLPVWLALRPGIVRGQFLRLRRSRSAPVDAVFGGPAH